MEDQCRLQYFREIQTLLARRHALLPPPRGLGGGFWNSGPRGVSDVFDAGLSEMARWNHQLAAAVAAAAGAEAHETPSTISAHLHPPRYADSDDLIADVTGHHAPV